jgi:hypothetical protein
MAQPVIHFGSATLRRKVGEYSILHVHGKNLGQISMDGIHVSGDGGTWECTNCKASASFTELVIEVQCRTAITNGVSLGQADVSVMNSGGLTAEMTVPAGYIDDFPSRGGRKGKAKDRNKPGERRRQEGRRRIAASPVAG